MYFLDLLSSLHFLLSLPSLQLLPSPLLSSIKEPAVSLYQLNPVVLWLFASQVQVHFVPKLFSFRILPVSSRTPPISLPNHLNSNLLLKEFPSSYSLTLFQAIPTYS